VDIVHCYLPIRSLGEVCQFNDWVAVLWHDVILVVQLTTPKERATTSWPCRIAFEG
jgi:hypothetical protein